MSEVIGNFLHLLFKNEQKVDKISIQMFGMTANEQERFGQQGYYERLFFKNLTKVLKGYCVKEIDVIVYQRHEADNIWRKIEELYGKVVKYDEKAAELDESSEGISCEIAPENEEERKQNKKTSSSKTVTKKSVVSSSKSPVAKTSGKSLGVSTKSKPIKKIDKKRKKFD